jgi:hypothetical protein
MTRYEAAADEAVAFFDGHAAAWHTFEAIRGLVGSVGPAEVHVSTSQVAFWRRRAFAYVWMPGRWLRHPSAEVVLSIALGLPDPSPRFKEVVHPARGIWMHHMEVHRVADLDDEVRSWLREAYEHAG